MDRFFGGQPLAVVLKLVIMSIVVGIVLTALNLDALSLIRWIRDLAQRIYDLGFKTFDWLIQYFIVGAVVVIPVWLISRLLRSRKQPGDGGP